MSDEQAAEAQPQGTEVSEKPPHKPAPARPAEWAMGAAPLTGQKFPMEESNEDPDKRNKPPVVPVRPQQPPQQPPVSEHPQDTVTTPVAPAPMPPQPLDSLDPATASLLRQTMNMQRPVSQRFYLVVIPESDWPTCEKFDTVDELIDRIKSLLGTPCNLFPFLGTHMPITKGPGSFRFISTPTGSLPLFDMPEPDGTAEEEHGWVGTSSDLPSYAVPAQAESTAGEVIEDNVPEDEPALGDDDTPMF